MGLHRGHAIAVTSNDSVDYVGQTVNIAARIQAMADAGQVCISEDVYGAAGVADLLTAVSVERDVPLMKGVAEEIPVYRLDLGRTPRWTGHPGRFQGVGVSASPAHGSLIVCWQDRSAYTGSARGVHILLTASLDAASIEHDATHR